MSQYFFLPSAWSLIFQIPGHIAYDSCKESLERSKVGFLIKGGDKQAFYVLEELNTLQRWLYVPDLNPSCLGHGAWVWKGGVCGFGLRG